MSPAPSVSRMEAVALIGMYGAMTISLAAAVMVTVAVLRMWFS